MPSCRSRARPVTRPWLAFALLWCLACGGAAGATDLRILVPSELLAGTDSDTDAAAPRDALGLLIDLLPRDIRAGIWIYDDAVATLAPRDTVNSAWRLRALDALREFSAPSRQQPATPDLEAALAAAAGKWQAEERDRHIILVTTTDRPATDLRAAVQRSRARIMTQAVPALHAARVRIHVLVQGQGEASLAGRLAAATGGLLLRAPDEEALGPALMELVGLLRPVSLPVRHGELIVDEGIEEITLLLFRGADGPATILRAPDGQRHSAVDAGRGLRPDLHWRHTDSYETVTIARPASGVWRLDTPASGIQAWFSGATLLRVQRPPAHVLAGERIALFARAEGSDDTLLTVIHQPPGGNPVELVRAVRRGAEPLRVDLPGDLAPGVHRFSVQAAGPGFQRIWRHRLEIIDSPLHQEFTRKDGKALLSLVPRADVVQAEGLHIGATLTLGRSFVARLPAERIAPQEWRLDLSPHESPRMHHLTLETAGKRARGGVLLHQDRRRGFDTLGLHPPEPLPTPATPRPGRTPAADATRSGLAIAGLILMLASLFAAAAMLMLSLYLRRSPPAAPARSATAPAGKTALSAPEATNPRVAAVAAATTHTATRSEPAPAAAPNESMLFSDASVLPDIEPLMKKDDAGAQPAAEERQSAAVDANVLDPLGDIDIAGIELDFTEEAGNPA